MARLFPSKPVGPISSLTARVLHAFKRIPGEDLMVWIALPWTTAWRPALMVLHGRKSCLLIETSASSEAQVETILHGDLFAMDEKAVAPEDFERQTRDQLHAYRRGVLAAASAEYGGDSLPIVPVIALPNVPQQLLDQVSGRGVKDCELWGSETLRSESLLQRIESISLNRSALPPEVVDALRQKFSPEIGIPESFVARVEEKAERDSGPKMTGFFLDLNQEFLAKEDLTLSHEADAALHKMRVRLLTGVAGSGKSLVLLYRAMLQAKLQPEARILILTHNKPLNAELREKFRELCSCFNVQWSTFYQWCHDFSDARWQIVKPWERETIIRELSQADPILQCLPLSFLLEEIDWIRDHGISTRDEYVSINRLGRKRPLQDEHRSSVFRLLEEYRSELDRRGLEDWPGAAASVWRRLESGGLKPPAYDFIFVDEAQFFAPVWFHIVKCCLRTNGGELFLAADSTQGFLKRRQSWAASGIDVRGHSARLRRCYRNTREILEFATVFYRRRLWQDEEDINLFDPAEGALLQRGDAPRFLHVSSPQGERLRVASEIAAAIGAGAIPEHFLVLQNDSALVAPFIEILNKLVGRPIARYLNDNSYDTAGVRVSSLNAATGLECPIVFLCGVDGLLEKEDALGLADDEKSELVRDNTRRIYMGMTRASRKLVVTYCRPATKACLDGGTLEGSFPGPNQLLDKGEPIAEV